MEERMQKIVGEYAFDDDEDDVLLPGFRFHPTDEELVGFYLRRKVANKPLSIEIIKEIDIYKYDPWDLPKVVTAGEKEFFFFCLRGRKYRNSIRPNRVTGSGFWKATGIDKPIYSAASSSDCIGLKKSLVYYRGSAGKGTKTEWMMHEFRLPSSSKNTDDSSTSETWTICRIFKRSVSYRRQQNNKQINYNPIYTDSVSSITTNASFANSNSLSHSNTGEMEFLSNYYSHEDHNQVHQEQYWNSIFQSTINCHDQNTSQSPSMDELFSGDCSWDEFGGIMNFMADLNSP